MISDEPFNGDPNWKVVRTLRDGAPLTVRPIRPEDRDELRREFEHTSPETRYLRFLGIVGQLSDAMLTYLTSVDQKDHVALVATITTPDLKTERGVGVARFIRSQTQPDIAEAAITVADDVQRRGVGSLLAHEIERAARAAGIRVIRADVLETNAAMRAILEGTGATCAHPGESPGTLSYDIELDPAPVRSRLIDVLRGAAQTMAIRIRKL